MVKGCDGCGADMGRRGANGGVKVGLCNASKLECGGMEGVGGKALAMNRLVIGFNGAVYRQFACFL
ncbi:MULTISPECIES: hypothetical protein [unclassified Bartonella]|uniref:hypothetical protein n=1 Tax=unclassified Bartonella TaxID=2645622 RepID=UPI0035CF892B